MGFFDYIIACVLALVGGALTFILGRLIIVQLLALLKIKIGSGLSSGMGKIGRLEARVDKADSYIQKNELLKATNELQKAVVLDNPSSKDAVLKLKEHHQNVLSRCLIIAEEQGSRIDNIADVEKLLSARIDLQLDLIRNKETLREFQSKRKMRGKKTPSWGTNEFVSKIKAAQTELVQNKTDLNLALRGLFKSLQSLPKEEDIVYH